MLGPLKNNGAKLFFLIGTKSDLKNIEVDTNDVDDWTKDNEIRFLGNVSAKKVAMLSSLEYLLQYCNK